MNLEDFEASITRKTKNVESDSINQKLRNACVLKTVDGLLQAFLLGNVVQHFCAGVAS
jgi:hypothetical protein